MVLGETQHNLYVCVMLGYKNRKVEKTYKSETTLDTESSQLNQILRKSKLQYH